MSIEVARKCDKCGGIILAGYKYYKIEITPVEGHNAKTNISTETKSLSLDLCSRCFLNLARHMKQR